MTTKQEVLKFLQDKKKETCYKSGIDFRVVRGSLIFTHSEPSIIKAILELGKEGILDFYLRVTCPECNEYIEVKENYSRYVKDECPHCGRVFTVPLKDALNYITLK